MDGIDTSVRERPKVKVNPAACAPDLQAVAGAIETLASPGYDQASVTELAKPAAALSAAESGKGPEYRSIVHRCLEWMANGREPTRRDIELLGVEFELDPTPVDEILAELQRVKQSDLWRRAMAVPEHHTEVPFSLALDGANLGREPGPVMLSGVIDLAFREGDRWHLVNYKTDRIAGDASSRVAFYAEQLRLYREAWQHLTGRAPSETLLLFTDACAADSVT